MELWREEKFFKQKKKMKTFHLTPTIQILKQLTLFLLLFLQIFFLLILTFLYLYFVRQTEQYLVSHLLVYPEAGIES